jgi:hypothetical protein
MKRFSLNISALVLLAIGLSSLSFAQQDINLFEVNGVALGSPSNYGTSPGAVEVSGVNAFVTNSVAVTGTFWQTTQPVSGTFWQTTQPVSGSGVFEVGPTTSANTVSNPFYFNLSDGTNNLTSTAITTWGTAPTGKVLGVNANIMSPIDGSGYVEVNCKTGCGAGSTTISLIPEATGGLSHKHFVAAASDNATSLKGSAGQVYSVDVFNNAAYPVYLKLYNSASSPTGCAATNLFKVVGVQSGTQHTVASEEGFAMGTGIGYCLTKGIADSDDTAVLLSDASADIGYK